MEKFIVWAAATFGILILIGAVSLLSAMLSGWVLMLILGGLHHSVWASVPALAYWQSVLVAFALTFLRQLLFGSTSVSKSQD